MKAKIELRVGEQREKVISDGVGFYSKGRLRYFELDQKTKQEVWFDQDKIEIVRKGGNKITVSSIWFIQL